MAPNPNRRNRHQAHDKPSESTKDSNNDHWPASQLIRASYRDLGSPPQVQARFLHHLQHHCSDAIRKLLQDTNRTSRDYSMRVDTFELLRADPILGFLLLRYPTQLLPLLELAIVQAQEHMLAEEITKQDEQGTTANATTAAYSIKGHRTHATGATTTRVHPRLVHLPPTCCKPAAALTAQDVGKIVQVSGTVVRTGPVQMYESARTYQCCGGARGGKNRQQQQQQYCGQSFLVYADLEHRHNTLQDPEICPGFLPNGDRCSATKFKVVDASSSVHTDYQEVKIQDANTGTGSGTNIPRSLLLKLQHDLVDQCQPGDAVAVVGILLAQWPPTREDCNVSLALSAHSIRVIVADDATTNSSAQQIGEMEKYRSEFSAYWNNEPMLQPVAARDFITKAICPKLYGMQVVKLALLLTLIGGVPGSEEEDDDTHHEHDEGVFTWTNGDADEPSKAAYFDNDAHTDPKSAAKKVQTRRRDQSHILLVGDPGTGVSWLVVVHCPCPSHAT